MPRARRQAAVRKLLEQARALSGDFDVLSEVVAARVGLNQTDLLAMDLISRDGGVTAGQLAERLQLTTGAITGVIDRLEQAGFARRTDDPGDRRRVLVVATARESRIARLYDPLASGMRTLAGRYSADELVLLSRFVGELRAVVEKSIQGIRRHSAPPG
jgi:DNA-binding MarR family transcriptional regulator